jgi:hypothetical protein
MYDGVPSGMFWAPNQHLSKKAESRANFRFHGLQNLQIRGNLLILRGAFTESGLQTHPSIFWSADTLILFEPMFSITAAFVASVANNALLSYFPLPTITKRYRMRSPSSR